jgi:hypothetical protein
MPALFSRVLSLDDDPNQYDHAPLKRALEARNYGAIALLIEDPRLELTRSELYALLALLGDVPACSGIVSTLMHSRRFSHHFTYQKRK